MLDRPLYIYIWNKDNERHNFLEASLKLTRVTTDGGHAFINMQIKLPLMKMRANFSS
jgi:hypothetical protein